MMNKFLNTVMLVYVLITIPISIFGMMKDRTPTHPILFWWWLFSAGIILVAWILKTKKEKE